MLSRMVDQIFWANNSVINWIVEQEKENEIYLKLMSHILNASSVWICRANNKEANRDTFKLHPTSAMRAINEENYRELIYLVKGNTNKEIFYSLFDGTPGKSTIEEIILHVFSHGFHHFGQMSSNAARLEMKFPNVSYIGFTRSR